jgi:hypothetical protein
MGLLPRWTLFSGVPEEDIRVFIRDRLVGGSLSPWRLVKMPKRDGFRFIWNPGRRNRKSVEDLCLEFTSSFARQLCDSEKSSPQCFWYLALAHFVSQEAVSPLTHSRQFMIAKTFVYNTKPAEIIFVSSFFQLPDTTVLEVANVMAVQHTDASDVSACARSCHS